MSVIDELKALSKKYDMRPDHFHKDPRGFVIMTRRGVEHVQAKIKAVVTFEGADGTESTSTVRFWMKDAVVWWNNLGTEAQGWRLRIPAQDTVDGDLRVGTLNWCNVHAFGTPYSFGRALGRNCRASRTRGRCTSSGSPPEGLHPPCPGPESGVSSPGLPFRDCSTTPRRPSSRTERWKSIRSHRPLRRSPRPLFWLERVRHLGGS